MFREWSKVLLSWKVILSINQSINYLVTQKQHSILIVQNAGKTVWRPLAAFRASDLSSLGLALASPNPFSKIGLCDRQTDWLTDRQNDRCDKSGRHNATLKCLEWEWEATYKQARCVSTVDWYWPNQQVTSTCWNVAKLRTLPVISTYMTYDVRVTIHQTQNSSYNIQALWLD